MNIHAMKERLKRIFTPRVLTIGACAVAGLLICAGGYRLIRYSMRSEIAGTQNPIVVATPRKTPFSPNPQTFPPVPTAPVETFQVLSMVQLKDGRTITYSYGEDYMTAVMDGKEILRITFDKQGNTLSQVYKSHREIGMYTDKHYYLCEYDNAGRLIKRSLYTDGYGKNDLLVCTTVLCYDSNGNLTDTQTEYTEPLPKSGDVTYEADKWGYLKKTYTFNPEYDYESIYDFRGNVVKQICNKVMEYEDFVEMHLFDDSHRELEEMKIEERFDWKGATMVSGSYLSFSLRYRFLYDPNGQLQPASFFGGYWNAEPYTKAHVPGDSCIPEYDAAGKLIRCAHDPNEYFWREYEFDENQRLIKQRHHIFLQGYLEANYEYGSDGRLRKLTSGDAEYYYDEKGRVCQYKGKNGNVANVALDLVFDAEGRSYMKKWTFTSDTEPLPLQSVEYFYDTAFERIGTHFCFPEENGGCSVHEYDANGIKKREIYYDKNGAFQVRKDYSYNEQGWMVRCDKYDESGVLLGWLEYRHNGLGECIGWDYYTDEGKLFSNTEQKRDELGRPIKITYHENGMEESRGLYEYDKNGCVKGYSDGVNSYTFTDVPEAVYRIYARCDFERLLSCLSIAVNIL